MQRHPCSRRLGLSRRAATIPHAYMVMTLALLLGGCGNSGIRGSHPDAGLAGQGGTQSSGSSPGGTGGAESSGGRATGGIAATSGGSLSGGSTATGGAAGRAGGTTSSTGAGTAGQASGGTSVGGGATATAGGGSGGAVGGISTAGTGSYGGASSSGTRGDSGGTGGADGSTRRGGSASAGAGGSAGAGSGGSRPAGGTFAASGAIETAVAPIITSFCAAARHCCSLAGISTTSLSDCESQFVKRNPILGTASIGEASIDTTAVAACQAAYDEAADSCSAKAVRSACTNILVGKQSESALCGRGGNPTIFGGMACDHTAGATACLWTGDTNDPAVTGICLKIPHGKKGDPCLYTCESGVECSFEQMGGPSDTLITLCFEDEGLFCSGETDPASCQPSVAQGGSCDSRPDACKSTDYCDSVSKTCKAASTAGQSCLYSSCLRQLSCGADKKCAEPFWELATEYGSCAGIAQLQ